MEVAKAHAKALYDADLEAGQKKLRAQNEAKSIAAENVAQVLTVASAAAFAAASADKSEPVESPLVQLGKTVAERFGDGKWLDVETIAKHVDASEEDVQSVFQNMVSHHALNIKCEEKPVGPHFHYRIFPLDRRVSTIELSEKLQPILDGHRVTLPRSHNRSEP